MNELKNKTSINLKKQTNIGVMSRGSQYRVESVMIRLTKAANYLLLAPSKAQVAQQRGMCFKKDKHE